MLCYHLQQENWTKYIQQQFLDSGQKDSRGVNSEKRGTRGEPREGACFLPGGTFRSRCWESREPRAARPGPAELKRQRPGFQGVKALKYEDKLRERLSEKAPETCATVFLSLLINMKLHIVKKTALKPSPEGLLGAAG